MRIIEEGTWFAVPLRSNTTVSQTSLRPAGLTANEADRQKPGDHTAERADRRWIVAFIRDRLALGASVPDPGFRPLK